MGELLTQLDAPTLRRIALLALRVSQDSPALRPSLREVATLVDQMKRSVALGTPFEPSEVRHLKRLLTGMDVTHGATSMLEAAMLDELRDLARVLPPR